MPALSIFLSFFFFNDTATTEIYTLSLHDALPISKAYRWSPKKGQGSHHLLQRNSALSRLRLSQNLFRDRKSTRLNSSHANISYAVFCLKKKNPPTDARVPSSSRSACTSASLATDS